MKEHLPPYQMSFPIDELREIEKNLVSGTEKGQIQ